LRTRVKREARCARSCQLSAVSYQFGAAPSALRAQLSAISRQLSVWSGAKRATRAVDGYQPSAISLERRQARYARS